MCRFKARYYRLKTLPLLTNLSSRKTEMKLNCYTLNDKPTAKCIITLRRNNSTTLDGGSTFWWNLSHYTGHNFLFSDLYVCVVVVAVYTCVFLALPIQLSHYYTQRRAIVNFQLVEPEYMFKETPDFSSKFLGSLFVTNELSVFLVKMILS